MNAYLDNDNLKEYAISYILYKNQEGFSFSSLTQFHYHMVVDDKSKGIVHASAAIEFLMLALDILDDLQDQDDKEKPWSLVSLSTSMNISTGFLMLSTLVLRQSRFENELKIEALQYLDEQVLRAVEGQHKDLQCSCATEEEFVSMMKEKSGSLMACATLVGATLQCTTQHEIIRDYSENFGVAAQLANDIEGLLRLDTKNDLLHKQWTLPIMLLAKESDREADWIRAYYAGKVDKEFMVQREEELFQWIYHSPVVSYVKVLKRLYQRKALERMLDLQVSQAWKDGMQEYIEHI
ncbi:class 1 isoprenoid biosynthesis enzyme [Gracilibacillus salinarum]|uniref:Class 1 isoprenoid biosynthesis enzyme n=1 Tax=Gracilibacillus salinarum TaxID=2932255 RepID=A0ABY4GJ65_9BACI|nr:class 1 isoprenoid biosynthesis enzyme [Gracilibacillus salinarum]UOQ84279.1 class 1 isoprenoid biosynthesis enzyme [Gracilibacillus salinarum]